jgi:C4-dicarboxylate-specific signal transduction histidine kinase
VIQIDTLKRIAQRREREARLMTGDLVAVAIAHEVRQPLSAIITNADAGLRFLSRAMPDLDEAKAAFKRASLMAIAPGR